MVKVDGKVYTNIEITISEAIHVLFEDCIANGKDIFTTDEKQLDDKSLSIKTALYTVSSYIKKFIWSSDSLCVRCVLDTKTGEFSVDSSDVLNKVIEIFCRGRRHLCTSAETDTPEKKGVYSYYDSSQHGSPVWKYTMLYKGITAEKTFEALEFLKQNYTEFINSKTDGQTRTLEK